VPPTYLPTYLPCSQPLTVAVLAALLFNETLSGPAILGLFVGVAGLLLLEVPAPAFEALLQQVRWLRRERDVCGACGTHVRKVKGHFVEGEWAFEEAGL
jgi:hypothetical protein